MSRPNWKGMGNFSYVATDLAGPWGLNDTQEDLSYTLYEDYYNGTDGAFSYSLLNVTQIVFSAVSVLISLVGIVGNSLVIVVTRSRLKGLQRTMGLFILNLSVADLVFLIFCMPISVVNFMLPSWSLGVVLCKAMDFLIYTSMLASIFTLVVMSLDRFTAVVYPIRLLTLRSMYTARLVVILIWVVSTIFASPYLFLNQVLGDSYQNYTFYKCVDVWHDFRSRRAYYTFIFLVGYLVPLLLITCAYVLILHALWRTLRIMNGARESSFGRAKRKVTVMVSVVVLVFGLCWFPHHLIYMWQNFGSFPIVEATYHLKAASLCLSYLNSSLNPIIYSIISENFRRGMRMAVHKCGGTTHKHGGSGPYRGTPAIRMSPAPATPMTLNQNQYTPTPAYEMQGRNNPAQNIYRKRLEAKHKHQKNGKLTVSW